MDAKNRLTNRLLKIAKKHRILTYPVLALVALISVFSYFFNWSTGAGKRIVAIVMVMVMLVSQSCFLTSSATEVTDDSVTPQAGDEIVDNTLTDTSTSGSTGTVTDTPTGEPADPVSGQNHTNSSEDDLGLGTDIDIEDDDSDLGNQTNGLLGDPNAGIAVADDDLLRASEPVKILFDSVDYNGQNVTLINDSNTVDLNVDGTAYDLTNLKTALTTARGDKDGKDPCYAYVGLYLDINCSVEVPDSLDATSSYIQGSGASKQLLIYCRRELDNYEVQIETNGSGDPMDTITYQTDVNGTVSSDLSTIYVPASGDVNNKSGSFTISSISRYGYTATLPTVNGGGYGEAAGTNGYTIHLSGQGSPQRIVQLNWDGATYQIRYCKRRNTDAITDGDYITQTLKYGDITSSYYTQNQAGAVDYTGYEFDKWSFGSDSREPGTNVSMADHHKLYQPSQTEPVTLYPTYTYAGIEVADVSERKFQFAVKQDEKIQAVYKYTSGSNRDKNGKFTYTIDQGCINALANVGIIVTSDQDGIYLNTDGPSQVTVLDLKFTVTDSQNGETTGEITIPIRIDPQAVTIAVPDNWKDKIYDGNANVNTDVTDTIPTNQKYPDGTDITVTYGKASYNNEKAGDDKIITFTGCTLKNVPAAYTNCYVLEGEGGTIAVSGCRIKKRTIYVHTTTDIHEIRAGEPNPDASHFGIELNDDGNEFVGSDGIEALGEITYTIDPSREGKLEDAYDQCYIIANASATSNYTVKCYKEDCAYFKVTKETPRAGVNYSIEGTQSNNDWYIGEAPILKPIKSNSLLGGGYDEIRISYDGGSHFTEWASSVSLTEYSNGNIKIQLRSDTGAITSIGNLDIDYDPSGPEYLGYTFTVDDENNTTYDSSSAGGLYFPSRGGVLSFGTYVNATIHIKVKFEDPASGLQRLNYSIYTSDMNKVAAFDSDGTAMIELSKALVGNGRGVIRCQATDKAGNVSKIIVLQPDEYNNANYEWSVETVEPDECNLSVTYGDATADGLRGSVTDQSGIYYRNCVADLHVVDNESGIKNVKWYVNDELIDTGYSTDSMIPNHKVTSADFSFGSNDVFVSSMDTYTVKAVVEDNAGNTKDSGEITFLVDNDAPQLHVDYDEDVNKWISNEEITFTTSDDISGVAYAQVLKSDGVVTNIELGDQDEAGEYAGKFTITGKGMYTVTVADKAGNIREESFNIQNISTEVPSCPEVTITPETEGSESDEFWYNSITGAPTIHINCVTNTTDGTPVSTYYRHFKNDETAYDDVLVDDADGHREISVDENDEAIHHFIFWSESASGVKCDSAESHEKIVRYDKTAPEITVKNVPKQSSGSSVYIAFTITDEVSGVNKDSVTVLRNGRPYEFTVEETEKGFAGSFVVDVNEKGNYVVMASDIAGNEMSVAGFTPMNMVVNPVSNITTSKATISATVTRGTANVTKAPVIMIRKATEKKYRECTNAVATQDENGNWSISALLENLDANTVYDYKVRAVSDIHEVIEREGSLRTSSLNDEGGIVRGTVGYLDGMVLPDWNSAGIITVGLFEGNVCVAATTADAGGPFAFTNIPDGTYNIVATDGVYKKSLGVTVSNHVVVSPTTAISLILSGQNTSVVIMTPNTPYIIAENMDSIFAYDHVNFNEEDSAVIDENGTVEFRLCATLMEPVGVSNEELSVIGRVQSGNKVVKKYLSLTLVKIVTDEYGVKIKEEPVTELANGASVTITIPMQDLAGTNGVEIVRVHDGSYGLEGFRYESYWNQNTGLFTLTSNKFSTYAVLAPRTNGNNSDQPTTERERYEEFVAERPATNQPTTGGNSSSGGSNGVTNTSFRSVSSGSGSAKTGDTTPIAMLGVMMMTSLGGVFVLRRKMKRSTK